PGRSSPGGPGRTGSSRRGDRQDLRSLVASLGNRQDNHFDSATRPDPRGRDVWEDCGVLLDGQPIITVLISVTDGSKVVHLVQLVRASCSWTSGSRGSMVSTMPGPFSA